MSPNQQMFDAWNGGESVHYVDQSDRYDRQLAPFADALLERVRLTSDESVLDIGCGCGVTTFAAARVARRAVGVDISTPLLEVAARRARTASLDNVEFIVADAQTYPFDEGAFDVIVSQFGLMFFDDPVAAFANLRHALAPGGRLAFITWQPLEANEWVMQVGRPVAKHVELPQLGGLAGGPGMFALKDPDEIASLLDAAGFVEIETEAISPTILIGGGGTVGESLDFLLGMGIVRGLLGRLEPEARDEAIEEIRTALNERNEPGIGIRLGTGAWLVTARSA
jgi:ubiquinone/menaquinone biosynthesis C-methylase UbiE